MADYYNNYMVRLVPIALLKRGGDAQSVRDSQVAFEVTPSFSEQRSAEYTSVTPVHMPGGIQVYKATNARTFEIGAHLVSRNSADALRNMANLQKLRSWLLPYFGGTDTLNAPSELGTAGTMALSPEEELVSASQRIISEGVQLRGAPPDVLYLYAYSTSANDSRGVGPRVNINRIPVVLTNLSITYPEDVDYIPVLDPSTSPTGKTEPFPRKMDVSLSLVETHSPREYEQFDLLRFKQGNLTNF